MTSNTKTQTRPSPARLTRNTGDASDISLLLHNIGGHHMYFAQHSGFPNGLRGEPLLPRDGRAAHVHMPERYLRHNAIARPAPPTLPPTDPARTPRHPLRNMYGVPR